MKHLKRSLTLPLAEVDSGILAFFLVMAVLGFADAAYLTVEHYLNAIPPCSITQGCEAVLTSPYATLLGVPVSLLGAAYYLIMALGSFLYLESKHAAGRLAASHSAILKWTLITTVLGFGASLWFLYLQLFVIHSICQYCIGSALISTVLFAAAAVMLRRSSKARPEAEQNAE